MQILLQIKDVGEESPSFEGLQRAFSFDDLLRRKVAEGVHLGIFAEEGPENDRVLINTKSGTLIGVLFFRIKNIFQLGSGG